MKIKILTLFFFLFFSSFIPSFAQKGILKGKVVNAKNNEPVPFASISIDGTSIGSVSDENGNYKIENIDPGTYNVIASFVGFRRKVFTEVNIISSKPAILDFLLQEESVKLETVEINTVSVSRSEESPVSMQTIGTAEIMRNPGGNRDISKVIQSLPGVATTLSFRNDIIIRGGSPNENRFFLDGIEVPNINHFATQGSSGGPVGMINVNFIREVDFYSGAFPANRGNALSSVLEFKQIEGNDEKLAGTFMVGSSDVGITLDGPLSKQSNFILSARRSYLGLLFQALKLPFLPTYNDGQLKYSLQLGKKDKIILIGLGAIDEFSLNRSVNDDVSDPDIIERNNYILGYLPVNTQWNYAGGIKWLHFSGNFAQTWVLSRNHLNNSAVKYRDNIEADSNLVFDYSSQEIENKFRFENSFSKGNFKTLIGAGCEKAVYTNSSFLTRNTGAFIDTLEVDSKLDFNKFSVFARVSGIFFYEKLVITLGIRTDFNDYSDRMSDPLEQFSPRLAVSFRFSDKWSLNFNAGQYYQLPPFTVLGYRDSSAVLVNKNNRLSYINSDHLVAGFEYRPGDYSKISVEGFYKLYHHYPFLLGDSVCLANLGADFGVIGNDAVSSTSNGRSYGLEFLAQQKLSKKLYGIVAYTLVRSEFTAKNLNYIASSWDNRHIVSITAGRQFGHGWEAGIKFRLLGGAPYTPYDENTSALINVWNIRNQGVLDYSRLNENRFPLSHGLDIRVDKKWYFGKWNLDVYFDVQNVYGNKDEVQPYLTVERDSYGNPVVNPDKPDSYRIKLLKNETGTVLPSLGIMVQF